MHDLLHDLRFAARLMLRRPLVTLAIVAILGVGIGANTVIFRVFSATFLRPLPFADEEALVRVYITPVGGGARISPRSDVFTDVRDHVTSFERVVGQRFMDLTLETNAGPDRVTGIGVTEGWVQTLGIRPLLGRTFSPEEERLGFGADVAVISHAAWRERFGGDPAVVGRVVRLDGRGRTIVGLMPPGLRYPYEASFWVPMVTADDASLTWGYNIQARLRAGVPLDRARAELERVAATLPSLQRMDGMTLLAVPLREALLDDDGRAVTGVLAAVGFLLLIVCANVAHLLLAESIARRREFAIRTALGASRGRTVRQLVTEGTLLALLGGASGLGVAAVAGSLATVLLPANLGQVLEGVPLDARVFGFTLAVSLAAGAVAGIVPAAWVSRRPPRAMLRAGEHGSVPVGTSRVGRVLIVSELALALVLLSGAGVALQDLERRQQRDLGYDADDLLTLNVALTGSTYDQAARRVGFLDAVLARMRALPGVSGAGAVTTFPADGQGTFLSRLEFEGQMPASDAPVIAHHRLVTEGFFEAMGMRLLRGRAIDATDLATSRPVAVVSRSVAERHWPGEDPIGRRLRERRVDGEAPWRTVVGVVGNLAEFYAETDLAWYVPLAQDPEAREARQAVFVVRTPDASEGGVRRLREAVWESDPAMAVFDVATAASLYGRSMAPRRSAGLLTGLFAGVGLLVAALGVYASVAFAVGSRRREIAVRIAVGADQDHVVRGFVREAGGLVLAGLVLGGTGSVVVSRWLVSVTGAPAPSAALVGGSAAVLAAAALVASYLPARRAARTDPAAELRAV